MTEQIHFHFSLSYIGKGNGNPLQCSCLENPRDRGAWWAAVYGVAQSWTRLKRLSSSSSSSSSLYNHIYANMSSKVTVAGIIINSKSPKPYFPDTLWSLSSPSVTLSWKLKVSVLLHDLRSRGVCPIGFSAGRDPVSLWTNGAEEHSMFPISPIRFFFFSRIADYSIVVTSLCRL